MKYLFLVPIIIISVAFKGNHCERLDFNFMPSIDSSKVAILKFNKSYHFMFDKTSKNAKLTSSDLLVIQELLNKCVREYNSSLIRDKLLDTIVVTNYKKQLVAVINPTGEKVVFVNCICEKGILDLKRAGYNWRTDTFNVSDGGNCYFSVFISLTNKQYRHLHVNGYA